MNNVSFKAEKGEIVGILGPNGAGKTTLLRMLGGILTPTSGNIKIAGSDYLIDKNIVKKEIGYLSGNTKLYNRISPRELLTIFGNLYEMSKENIEKSIEEISEIMNMGEFIDNRIENLSTGQTQRTSIARCLIHSPQIYIFDEPTLGLDVISSKSIIDFMKREKERGKTVLYSTHYMEEAETLCDRIIMIHRGSVIAYGTSQELKEKYEADNLRDLFILRDKKTIFMMIILPLLLYPILMVGASSIMSMSINKMEQTTVNIAFNNNPSDNLINILNKTNEYDEAKVNIIKVDDYKEALDNETLDAYVEINENNDIQSYKIYTNSSKNNSYTAEKRIKEALDKYKEEIVEMNLAQEGLDAQKTLEPITCETLDIAKNEEIAGNILGQILPFILIIGVLLGSIYPAIDVMAGEKERGTLETLFTLPISNLELVMGKYMAVSFCAVVTAFLNIISILISIGFMTLTAGIANEMGIPKFDFTQMIFPGIITMICIGLFAMVVSAISMCVCSLAKSFKDAQNYITPVMLIIMIPSYVSMIPNIELDGFTSTIPVVNISLLIKSVLSFKFDLNLIAIVFVSNFAFMILSVLLLSKMFNSEEILFGNNRSFSFLEKRSNIKKGTMPTISDGAILYAVGLVLLIYVGSLVQLKFKMAGLAITPLHSDSSQLH